MIRQKGCCQKKRSRRCDFAENICEKIKKCYCVDYQENVSLVENKHPSAFFANLKIEMFEFAICEKTVTTGL